MHPLRRGAKRYSKMKTILNGAKFYRDGRFETGDLAIEDGKIVAIGRPEDVALNADKSGSYTGKFLAKDMKIG